MTGVPIPDCDGSVHSVRRGQRATFEVGGGFVRRPAPSDGLLLDLRSETIFLPAATVRSALRGVPLRSRDAELRLGHPNESVVLEVKGGFCRRRLDSAGLLISTRFTTLLLPIPLTRTLLAELRSRTTNRQQPACPVGGGEEVER